MARMPSMEIFLRDPSPYLRKFQRKPRKTPNSQVDKRDWGLNLALPIQLPKADSSHSNANEQTISKVVLFFKEQKNYAFAQTKEGKKITNDDAITDSRKMTCEK